MKRLLRTLAILKIAARRLSAQSGLTLATLLGLVAIMGLTMSIPLYADAVYLRVLRQQLTAGASLPSGPSTPENAPAELPLPFLFQYIGSLPGPVSWEEVEPLDAYLTGPGPAALGLPRQYVVRHFKTENFRLFPQADAAYGSAKEALAWVKFGFVSNMAHQIEIIEGNFPAAAAPDPESPVEALAHQTLALELGLQVGETYVATNRQETEAGSRTTQIPVRIAGFWQTAPATAGFWANAPGAVNDLLLLPEETFLGRISPYMYDEINVAVWYWMLDASNLNISEAGPLLRRIAAIQQQTSALLPDTVLQISPARALQQYQQAANLLTILLYAFSVPILVLILTFISLVAGLSVGRQQNEIAVLRSRGATTLQIISLAAVEGLLLGLVALLIALPLARWLAELMGQTRSFLDFSGATDLRVAITPAALRFGLLAVGLALATQVLPTIAAARHIIVTYKQHRARTLRPPWWQRAWLDLLLLIPAGYGTYLLQQQASIVLLPETGAAGTTPFQNPLLLLVPALGIVALTLLFLRLLPLLMALLAWLAAHFSSVGFLLAARQLARSPGLYTAPMILLVLTLSLSTFTASLAQTLDSHLFDQTYYQIGADISLVDRGESARSEGTDDDDPFAASNDAVGEDAGAETGEAGPRFLFLPITDYLRPPGIQAATRVARYEAYTSLSGARQTGTYIGLDRANFAGIAYWRWDFAPSYLSELMNALALTPNGVLLPRRFMSQHTLQVGDVIQLNVTAYGQEASLQMEVVGGFDLFPTWYPDDGPLYVGNLDYFFEQIGGLYPYQVWLRAAPDADYARIAEAMRTSNLRVLNADASPVRVGEAQQEPERQGLFGVLSVGFSSAALFTVLGFILYALFSFRQRFIELGVLRAVGLSSGQMTVFLAWELAFLILTGLLLGTFLGAWASQLFIPSLQIGAEAAARTPPFLVEIAWPAIIRIQLLFAFLFLAALSVLVLLLLRMRIFQAIKLGETV